jgi:hypothetical protein
MSTEESLTKFCDALINDGANHNEDREFYYKLWGMPFIGYPTHLRTAFLMENSKFTHLYNFSSFTITDLDTKESQPIADGMDGILRHLKSVYFGDLEL